MGTTEPDIGSQGAQEGCAEATEEAAAEDAAKALAFMPMRRRQLLPRLKSRLAQ